MSRALQALFFLLIVRLFPALVGGGDRGPRFPLRRPVSLTAAAVLAMIPLSRAIFWGPMAVAVMGGLIAATFLTLFFLPALYAAWFRVQHDAGQQNGVAA